MAVTATAYGPLGLRLLKGEIDLDTDTLKATLHTSSYTPDKDHDYYSDVTNEMSGTGYTSGGETLTGVTTAYITGSDWTALTADPTSWPGVTGTYRYLVLRKDTGTPSTDPLILWIDFGSDQSVSAADVDINWADILRLVA